ncbi:hypothetical protein HKX48_007598 [Thoreauomyces humboldtii]|nr:hypothetical protein HKX48_007598 [Thoreauomyces humboldtii]
MSAPVVQHAPRIPSNDRLARLPHSALADSLDKKRLAARTVPQGNTESHNIACAKSTQPLHSGDNDEPPASDHISRGGAWDYINSVVDTTDDPTLPSFTPRVWFIGTLLTIGFSIANSRKVYSRPPTNPFNLPAVAAIILSLPCGRLLAKIFPDGRFNPGPFSIKENALCGIMIGSAFIPLGVFNFITQKYLLGQSSLTVISGVGFVLGTQLIGSGLSGYCRRFLVKPPSMLWPTALAQVALFKAINRVELPSNNLRSSLSSGTFFWIAFTGAAIYHFFPGYVAPLLSSLSILCISHNRTVRLLGAGSPMRVYFVLYVIVPILYYKNAFGMDQNLSDPASPYGVLNNPNLFNHTGNALRSPQMLLGPTGHLLNPVYQASKPIYVSTFYVVVVALSLFGYSATMTHTALWYGKQILGQFKTVWKEHHGDVDEDIHNQLMRAYPDVPDWWFGIVLIVAVPLVMATCVSGGFALSWWGVLVAIALAIVSILPVGVLQALSGTQLPLQTISLFLSGILFEGETFGVLSFNTIAYMGMAQGLVLVQDLKVAHYMKIPPRDMFIAVLWGKVLSGVIMTLTAVLVMENWRTTLLTQPQWQYISYRLFTTSAVVWGSIGTLRFFGEGSPYSGVLWSLLVGFLAPVIPWLCYRRWGGKWRLINVPLMSMIGEMVGARQATLVPLVICFLSNFYAKRYHHGLWSRYNYILAAALAAGTAVTTLFIAIVFGKTIVMPQYFLNPVDGEHCSP